HQGVGLAAPVEPLAEVGACEPPGGNVMPHRNLRIVVPGVQAGSSQARKDLVVLAGDQTVVDFPEIGPPSTNGDQSVAAKRDVRAYRKALAGAVWQVVGWFIAVVEQRERAPHELRL